MSDAQKVDCSHEGSISHCTVFATTKFVYQDMVEKAKFTHLAGAGRSHNHHAIFTHFDRSRISVEWLGLGGSLRDATSDVRINKEG